MIGKIKVNVVTSEKRLVIVGNIARSTLKDIFFARL